MSKIQRFFNNLSLHTKILVLFIVFIASAISTYVITRVYLMRLEKDHLASITMAKVTVQPQHILNLSQRLIESESDQIKRDIRASVFEYDNILDVVHSGGRLEGSQEVYPSAPDEIKDELKEVYEIWRPFSSKAKLIADSKLYKVQEKKTDQESFQDADVGFEAFDESTDPFANFETNEEPAFPKEQPKEEIKESTNNEKTSLDDAFGDFELEENTNGDDPFGDAGFEEFGNENDNSGFEDFGNTDGNAGFDTFGNEDDVADKGSEEKKDESLTLDFEGDEKNSEENTDEINFDSFEEETKPKAIEEKDITFEQDLEVKEEETESLAGLGFFSSAASKSDKKVRDTIIEAERFLIQNREKLEKANAKLVAAYTTYIEGIKTELDYILLLIAAFNILLISIGYLMIKSAFLDPLGQISTISEEILEGKMDHEIDYEKKNELGKVSKALNALVTNLTNSTLFVRNIAKGDLNAEFKGLDEKNVESGSLQAALIEMRQQLKNLEIEEKRRNWSSDGLAKFVEILRKDTEDMQKFCQNIVSNLVVYLEANQGGIFLLNKDEDNETEILELEAAYAFGRDKFLKKEIGLGEGLVGQCYYEQRTIYMTEVPQGYVEIKSGLGDATPECILIVPLLLNNELQGVLEIASFSPFSKHEIEFVERLGENIASTVSAVKVNGKTKMLLETSQTMTEQMRAQEEEMRQNMEEMEATQEEMNRKELELRKLYEESQEAEEELKLQKHAMEKTIREMAGLKQEAEEKSERFDELTSSLPGALYQFIHKQNGEQGYSYISSSISNILGIEAEEIIENKDKLDIHEEDQKSWENMLSESYQNITSRDWTGRVKKEDGRFAYIHFYSNPIKRENGDIVWSGYMNDVSERILLEKMQNSANRKLEKKENELRTNLAEMRAAQEELNERKTLLSAILNSSSMGVVQLSERGKMINFNKRFLEMSGHENDEIQGSEFERFFIDKELREQADKLSASLNKAIPPGDQVFIANAEQDLPENNQWTFKTKTGNNLQVEVSVKKVVMEDGSVQCYLAEIREMNIDADKTISEKAKSTQLRTLRKEIKEKSETIAELSSKLAEKPAGDGGNRDTELRMLAANNEAQKEMYEKKIQALEEEIKKLKP